MSEIVYQYMQFARLEPRTPWMGGRLADTDLATLDEAACFASLHAKTEITAKDVLRAASRGEIRLRAIVHHSAKIRKHDGGVYCNAGEPNENVIPKGAIPTLPLSACRQLANAGRASWRTIDGFVMTDDQLMRYDIAALEDGEPDIETVIEDCRVIGYDVHALADAYVEEETPAPVESSVSNQSDRRGIPGKMPNTGIGKLAIKAAWEIENETKRAATDKAVMERLQLWADSGEEPAILLKSDKQKHAVEWRTIGGRKKPYDIEACRKTLAGWIKSRA